MTKLSEVMCLDGKTVVVTSHAKMTVQVGTTYYSRETGVTIPCENTPEAIVTAQDKAAALAGGRTAYDLVMDITGKTQNVASLQQLILAVNTGLQRSNG